MTGIAAFLLAAALAGVWSHVANRLRSEVLNNGVEGKICRLQSKFGSAGIVIAGDSRAHYQLVPAVFEAGTGQSAVNVAWDFSDLVTFVNALDKHRELIAAAKLIIVSVGISQVNDGSVDFGFLSPAAFVNLGLLDHLRIYAKRPFELFKMYREVFRIYRMREWKAMRFECGDYWIAGYDIDRTKGFLENTRVWNRNVGRDPLLTNSWYMDLRMRGSRWRQFQEYLERLNRIGIPVVIFQSPYSPTWMADPVTAKAREAEREFGRALRDAVSRLADVHFLDFFAGDDEPLPDSLFFDAAHLNAKGARVFSERFVRELKRSGLPPF